MLLWEGEEGGGCGMLTHVLRQTVEGEGRDLAGVVQLM